MVHIQYVNDCSPKNVHWAVCTGVFGKRDTNRVEYEFLEVLDFDLGVSESDILSFHEPIMAAISPSHYDHPQASHQIVETAASSMDIDTSPTPQTHMPSRSGPSAPKYRSRIPIQQRTKAIRRSRNSSHSSSFPIDSRILIWNNVRGRRHCSRSRHRQPGSAFKRRVNID